MYKAAVKHPFKADSQAHCRYRQYKHDSTHRGRAVFKLMPVRPDLLDHLFGLLLFQPGNIHFSECC